MKGVYTLLIRHKKSVLSVVLIAVFVCWLYAERPKKTSEVIAEAASSEKQPPSGSPSIRPTQANSPSQNVAPSRATAGITSMPSPLPSMVYSVVPVTPLRSPVKPGETVRQAFRIVMENNRCTLQAIEEVHGEFRKLRHQTWAPGMLCCRLLNKRNEVVAEETVIAPDFRCVVLDPNQSDPQGKPQAARLTADGPVVFQAKFPKVDDAAILKIYRLSGSTPPQNNDEPEGQLLSAITFAQ